MQKSIFILFYLCLFVFSLTAQAEVVISLPEINGTVGEVKTIALNISDVTGYDISSYQFRVYYDPAIIAITGYDTDGTLTKQAGGMLAVNLNPTAGDYIIVAYAGINPLVGSGALLFLDVELKNPGTSPLTWSDVGFWNLAANEVPVDTDNGAVHVSHAGEHTTQYTPGWNLVGLPLSVTDPHYKTLYPAAIDETLWKYNGGYVNETELEEGRGYWLRFPGSGNVVITGQTIGTITLTLATGWNLIAGISYNVQLTEIDDPNGIIIPGTLWGFDGTYNQSETLEPGYGYWLRASGPGPITVEKEGAGGGASTEGAVIAQAGTAFDDMQLLGSLSVEDALGNMQRLYFVDDMGEGKNRLQYSMPPLPPSGGFDARFSNDYYIGTDHESIIRVQIQSYPLTVLLEDVEGEYILEAMRGEEILETYSVYAGSSVELMSESIEYFRLLNKERLIAENLPDDYGLSQNYPNPFNPSTIIGYALPQDAFVRLEVFNMLGQQVAVLVDGEQQAGYHSVVFDGSQLASGVYLYRLAADDFINMKRFVLLK